MLNFLSKKKNNHTPLGYFRCYLCNKKVLTVAFAIIGVCRCENLYCSKHRFPGDHKCTYDYKSEQIKKLKKILPVIVADKVPNRI